MPNDPQNDEDVYESEYGNPDEDNIRTRAYFLYVEDYSVWASLPASDQERFPLPDADYYWYEAERIIRHGGV